MPVAVGRARWGSLTKGQGASEPPFSPAHDLVGEQHAAHLRVFVLPLIDDGLGEGGRAQAQVAVGSSYVPVQGRDGHCPLGTPYPPSHSEEGLGVRAGTGNLTPQTRITTRTGPSGTDSIDSVCPQAVLSRCSSAWEQGPRPGWDGGRHSYPHASHPYHLPAQARVSPLDYWVSFPTAPTPPAHPLPPSARK